MTVYYKGEPSEHVVKYVKGRAVTSGRGLSFFFWPPTTSIVSIPLNTLDAEFAFNEITSNFQDVTVQGQVNYRVVDPERLAAALDYSIFPETRAYRSKDPAKLSDRVVSLVQEATRAEIQRLSLEDALRKSAELARAVSVTVRKTPEVAALGIAVTGVFITSMRPTPQVAKALEADYRELLLKKADEAIYDRRASAVEQERTIREKEMSTEISVEGERSRLVEIRTANLEKESIADGKALRERMAPYRELDASVLLALGLKGMGENAAKISNLTITPDLLSLILKGRRDEKGG